MQYEFHPAAAKHGISQERAIYVIEHPQRVNYLPGEEPELSDVTQFLGFDPGGMALEVGVIELADDRYLVIHVLKCRENLLGQVGGALR